MEPHITMNISIHSGKIDALTKIANARNPVVNITDLQNILVTDNCPIICMYI